MSSFKSNIFENSSPDVVVTDFDTEKIVQQLELLSGSTATTTDKRASFESTAADTAEFPAFA